MQFEQGGLVKSGGTFIGTVLCPFGAALFCNSRTAMRWFLLHLVSSILVLFIESSFVVGLLQQVQELSTSMSTSTSTSTTNSSSSADVIIVTITSAIHNTINNTIHNYSESLSTMSSSLTPQERMLFAMNICGVITITFFGAVFFSDRFEAEYKVSDIRTND